jgi:hypothetical protein
LRPETAQKTAEFLSAAYKCENLSHYPQFCTAVFALLLPGALLVAIRLQALLALMLVHLKTAFLFQVAHGIWSLGYEEGKG